MAFGSDCEENDASPAARGCPASLSARGAGSSSSMSKLAPTTHDAVERRQHHAAAHDDDARRLELVRRHVGELAAHPAQPQVRHRVQLRRVERIGEDRRCGHRAILSIRFRTSCCSRAPHASSCALTRERGSIQPASRKPDAARGDRHAGVRRAPPRASLPARTRTAGRRRDFCCEASSRSSRASCSSAALIPAQVFQALPPAQGMKKARPGEARKDAVVRRHHRMERSRRIAGRFLRRARRGARRAPPPSRARKPLAHRRAGEACADDHGVLVVLSGNKF